MPGRTPLARLGRVPPGVWTAVIWCAYTADSLRVYSGLPGMPREPSGLEPSAGLVLAAATTAAGVRVDVRWRGERRPLPPDFELAAYRIVQESVTNVVRHAGTRSCQVLIDDDGEALSIEVADQGQGPGGATSGTGCGLAGMRERVALLHGDFSAAPGPGGGFLVTARLPLPAKVTA